MNIGNGREDDDATASAGQVSWTRRGDLEGNFLCQPCCVETDSWP